MSMAIQVTTIAVLFLIIGTVSGDTSCSCSFDTELCGWTPLDSETDQGWVWSGTKLPNNPTQFPNFARDTSYVYFQASSVEPGEAVTATLRSPAVILQSDRVNVTLDTYVHQVLIDGSSRLFLNFVTDVSSTILSNGHDIDEWATAYTSQFQIICRESDYPCHGHFELVATLKDINEIIAADSFNLNLCVLDTATTTQSPAASTTEESTTAPPEPPTTTGPPEPPTTTSPPEPPTTTAPPPTTTAPPPTTTAPPPTTTGSPANDNESH